MLTTNIIDPTTGVDHPNPASCSHGATRYRSLGYGFVPYTKIRQNLSGNTARKQTDGEKVKELRKLIRNKEYNPHVYRAPIIFVLQDLDLSRYDTVAHLIDECHAFEAGDTFHRLIAHEMENVPHVFCQIVEVIPDNNWTWFDTATWLREWFNDPKSSTYVHNESSIDDKETTVLSIYSKNFAKPGVTYDQIKQVISNTWPTWSDSLCENITRRVIKYLEKNGTSVHGVVRRYEPGQFGGIKELITDMIGTGTLADHVESVNHVTITMGSSTTDDYFLRHFLYFGDKVRNKLRDTGCSIKEAVRKVGLIGQVVNTTETELDNDRLRVETRFREVYKQCRDFVNYVENVGEAEFFENFGPRWIAATDTELEKVDKSMYRTTSARNGKGIPVALKDWNPFPPTV